MSSVLIQKLLVSVFAIQIWRVANLGYFSNECRRLSGQIVNHFSTFFQLACLESLGPETLCVHFWPVPIIITLDLPPATTTERGSCLAEQSHEKLMNSQNMLTQCWLSCRAQGNVLLSEQQLRLDKWAESEHIDSGSIHHSASASSSTSWSRYERQRWRWSWFEFFWEIFITFHSRCAPIASSHSRRDSWVSKWVSEWVTCIESQRPQCIA